MPTDNHDYNVPDAGEQNWHVPLNENVEDFDTDIELRDAGAPGDNGYDPADGAKYLDTETGVVYEGDRDAWNAAFQVGRVFAPDDEEGPLGVAAGDPSNAASDRAATVGGGEGNEASDSSATVSGGSNNAASGSNSAIGGGRDNETDGLNSVIAGGDDNVAGGSRATVAGGGDNIAGELDEFTFSPTVAGGEENVVTGSYSVIGGGQSNEVSGSSGTIAGGDSNEVSGDDATVGGGFGNVTAASYATIGGGGRTASHHPPSANRVFADYGTIGGGGNNQVGPEDEDSEYAGYATVGGGYNNGAYGEYATIGGGDGNLAGDEDDEFASYATVGGGTENEATEQRSTVGGGSGNEATELSATVGGGSDNEASGESATVGGGTNNEASDEFATVGGGTNNVAAGRGSFAAGRYAEAMHDGTFVWNDGGGAFSSTGADQFLVDSGGGVGINTNDPKTGLHVESTSDTTESGLLIEDEEEDEGFSLKISPSGDGEPHLDFRRWESVSGADSSVVSAIQPDGNYLELSDAAAKRDVRYLESTLESVCALRPATFEYDRDDGSDSRSYGFVAQEVREQFPDLVERGSVDGTLMLDYSKFGVLAVQAIREQQELIDDQRADLTAQSDRIDDLEAENRELRERLAALEEQVGSADDRERTSADD